MVDTNSNGNGGKDQESYLASTPLIWDRKNSIVLRGLKKLTTEITSIKTLAMAAFIGLNYYGKLGDMATVFGVLGCIGAKEVDFTQVVNIIQSKFGK